MKQFIRTPTWATCAVFLFAERRNSCCTVWIQHVRSDSHCVQWRRNEFESRRGHQSDAKRRNFFGRAPPLVCSKSTISRFGERFRDGQYSLVSFLFAVLQLMVPTCPVICKSGGTCPPCPLKSTTLTVCCCPCQWPVFAWFAAVECNEGEDRLLRELFETRYYNKYSHPVVNLSETTHVQLGIVLIKIVQVVGIQLIQTFIY